MTFIEYDRRNSRDSDFGLLDVFSTSRVGEWPSIPHYYGNVSRQLLLAGAALMLLAAPLYADNVRLEFPFEIIGAIIAAGCAALTSPHSKLTLFADAIVAGVGTIVYSVWGIFEYDSITSTAFVLRLAVALVFLFGFYFSMKTVRAFALHQIGKRPTVDEFDESKQREDPMEESKRQFAEESEALQAGRFKPERERMHKPSGDDGDRVARMNAERLEEENHINDISAGRA